MENSDSIHRRYESNENLASSSTQPFNNNPSLPSTQRYNNFQNNDENKMFFLFCCRDIVGNNLQFNSASQNEWIDNENEQLAALLLYRDALKKNLTTPSKFAGGFPR